jgi:hypothetical protein
MKGDLFGDGCCKNLFGTGYPVSTDCAAGDIEEYPKLIKPLK